MVECGPASTARPAIKPRAPYWLSSISISRRRPDVAPPIPSYPMAVELHACSYTWTRVAIAASPPSDRPFRHAREWPTLTTPGLPPIQSPPPPPPNRIRTPSALPPRLPLHQKFLKLTSARRVQLRRPALFLPVTLLTNDSPFYLIPIL
jgi:hypothetical protein